MTEAQRMWWLAILAGIPFLLAVALIYGTPRQTDYRPHG
jgi:uncharacterized membrane protein